MKEEKRINKLLEIISSGEWDDYDEIGTEADALWRINNL